jgi:hypothetical protein
VGRSEMGAAKGEMAKQVTIDTVTRIRPLRAASTATTQGLERRSGGLFVLEAAQ